MNWLGLLLNYAFDFVIAFYLVLYGVYVYLGIASIYYALIRRRLVRLEASRLRFPSMNVPPVTVLVPAHNEEKTIVEGVRALLGLNYPQLEVIVVNDGSGDDTLLEMIRSFSLHRAHLVYEPLIPTRPIQGLYLSTLNPHLLVIDKVQGGKSDALNAAINLAGTPWVCIVDADSILEEDALLRVMRPVMEDGRVIASSGVVRVSNGCKVAGGRVVQVRLPRGWVEVVQVVEYLQGFLLGRLGWSWLNGMLIVAGSFGVFRTDVLRDIGGYSTATATEDLEIVVRIHRYLRLKRQAYRVVFVLDPVCWTEVPPALSPLSRQRRRWHRGLAEVLRMHRDLLFHRRMGLIGFFVLPFFVLELVAPLVELVGYVLVPLGWALGILNQDAVLLYLIVGFLMGTLLTLWAVLLEEFSYRRYQQWKDFARLVLYGIIAFPLIHPLMVSWRALGLIEQMLGYREWGRQERVGYGRR